MAEHSHRMEHSRNRDDEQAGEVLEVNAVEVTHDHDKGHLPHHHVRADELKREPEKKPDSGGSLWAWSGEE